MEFKAPAALQPIKVLPISIGTCQSRTCHAVSKAMARANPACKFWK